VSLYGEDIPTSASSGGGLLGMSGADTAPASSGYSTLALAQQAAAAYNKAQDASQKTVTAGDTSQLVDYLNSGDFSEAWKYAAGFGDAAEQESAGANPFAGNNTFANQTGNSSAFSADTGSQEVANPLIGDLESATGLNKIDPSLQWNAASEAAFYNAAQPEFNANILGYDPSGEWGSGSKLGQDATANYAAGAIPNFEQYAGIVPGESLGNKIATTAFTTVAPAIAIGIMTGGLGDALGGGLVGTAAAGAVGGAAQGALGDFEADRPITLGSVGKGSLEGAAAAAIPYELGPNGINVTGALVNAGVPGSVASGLVKGGTGLVTGAIGGALDGQGALAGAEAGATRGALSGVGNAVAGSIFNSGNTINTSGSTVDPTQTQSQVSNPTMSSDGSDFFNSDDTSQYESNPGYSPLYTDGGNGQAIGITPNVNYGQSGGAGYGGTSGGNLLSSLASMLGGSTGMSPSLLSQLLGMGSSALGGSLSSSAAKSAAGTFQNETMYKPYGTQTTDGTTAFNNGQLQTSLSPGAQANVNSLNGLAQSSANGLQQGITGNYNNMYNMLQGQQSQANNKMFQNNLDNQMASGVLSSTAGQYQSQAALNSINQQNLNDQSQAMNFANTQQQNQLSQLTGSLNGLQGYNTQQLQAGTLGGQLGAGQSSADATASSPWLAANSNSNIGSLLTGLGSGASNPFSTLGGY
jgi:hypothetical protein